MTEPKSDPVRRQQGGDDTADRLKASEERFHKLVDAVTDYAIYVLDADGRVATWNVGAERIKGYGAHEIVGTHFGVFYTPEDRAAGKPDRVLETVRREGRFEEENWRVRRDGTRFWASVVLTAMRDEGGDLVGYAKVTRDLSERRTATERLRQSEQRFHHLVDAITDYAVFVLDPDGHVTTWNRGAEALKGYTASEALGLHFSVFYTQEERAAGKPSTVLDAVRRDGRFEDESVRVRKDGSRFWANVVITALRGDDGEIVGFAKVTRDLTERRRAEEERLRLVKLSAGSEEASRMKDEFLATVSHELRTPLNAILGWASLVRERPLDPSLVKPIEVIHRNAQAQAKIIEDILDVSRIITGKLKIEPRPSDLRVIAREALEVVRPSAIAKRIELAFQPDGEPCLLVADPERLQQVVWNLLSNAVKFTDAGGRVTLSLAREGSSLVLEVSDTGRGIEPEFLPYVFDRFRQADGGTTRRFGGLGLGLALVRHIVELHGGRVSADSAGVGHGATLRIMLPVRAVSSAAESAGPGAVPPRAAPVRGQLAGLRVLVVDDEDDARDLLETLLTDAGAAVSTARSGREAMAQLASFRPDVLVSDVGMPGEDGYTFIRRVRSLPAADGGHVPSLALTAFARDEDRARALAAGYTAHLGKPALPATLIRMIEDLARLARP